MNACRRSDWRSRAICSFDLVVAECGDVKDGRDFVSRAGLLQQFEQVAVRIEQVQMTLLARTGMRRTAALETKHFKTSERAEALREKLPMAVSEPPGGRRVESGSRVGSASVEATG